MSSSGIVQHICTRCQCLLRWFCQRFNIGCMKYSVRAAAIATGITESRLRTWERRYGIPNPGRSPNGRRQYDEADLEIIRRMASLVSAGVPASLAAEVARSAEPLATGPAGEAVKVEDPLVARVLEAAATYDEAELGRAIQDALASHDWGAALDEVFFPALRAIGESWSEDSIASANEHFASEVIRRELCAAIARLPAAPEPLAPPILLACPEDERHDLGLLGLFLLLRERRVHTVYLGADVPVSDLVNAVTRLQPRAVCLSATLPQTLASLRRSMRALISARACPRLYAGGPAVVSTEHAGDVPAVLLPASLSAAADVLAAV